MGSTTTDMDVVALCATQFAGMTPEEIEEVLESEKPKVSRSRD